MTCTGCTRCEDGPWKTLADGRVVCHRCEDWRAECEARVVINMPTVQERRKFIADVTRARGEAAAEKLKQDIRTLWYVRTAQPGVAGDNTGSS